MERFNAEKMGANLKTLRGKKPQREVAAAIGVTQAAYGAYEKGIRIPRDPIKANIANYYGKSIQEIFF